MTRTDMAWELLSEPLEAELSACFERHWRESGTDREDVPLSLDWARYRALESSGIMRSLIARRAGALVGYAGYVIGPHLMYSGTCHIMCDSIYVLPEHRGVGCLLVKRAERDFRARFLGKAFRIIYNAPAEGVFSSLLSRFGYAAKETTHIKLVRPA